MRIRVSDVLDLLGAGVEADEILREYPDLQRKDIEAAVHWAGSQTHPHFYTCCASYIRCRSLNAAFCASVVASTQFGQLTPSS
ncbi:hypothetical protein GCM10010840_09110 [Deinococcus aerolatus]|uniref:DUF433 domain-containing protein n=2 Tax=Deinococcus aerolatus TaxID=522487 RepID=A0ABQ2G3W0_9DEIO|nr:hypothetical protein GCM10010840_09110 [Deinococcus aerolatus]